MGNRDRSLLNMGAVSRILGQRPGSYAKQSPQKRRWLIEIEVIDSPEDKDSYLGRKDIVALLNLNLDSAATAEIPQAKIRILAVRQEGTVK